MRRANNLTIFTCRLSWNLGASTSWKPQGLSRPVMQGRIKLFGAPRQWKHFRPLFQGVFLSGGVVLPPRQSNTTPLSPKTEITNILFYILNLWRRTYCSGLRGCYTREKEIVIWPCWCFHGRYYFYSLKFNLTFINEKKRNANTYLISNFDSLEAAPSNLPS